MTILDVTYAATSNASASSPALPRPGRSRRAVWTGRVLSGLALAFLVWDTLMKLIQHPMALEGSAALGFAPHTVLVVGVIEALCVVLYAVPRTAPLGAVLWTGYLGGAIATHLRLENPLFSHTLFPIYFAVLLWGGLALRDRRVLSLLERPRA
jgi:hypothetical protein